MSASAAASPTMSVRVDSTRSSIRINLAILRCGLILPHGNVRMPIPTSTVMPSPSSFTRNREALREVLRGWAPAAGPDGFEGIVAHALVEITALTFRLVRSGAQFGRNACTPAAPFLIASEAKRYTQSVPLQDSSKRLRSRRRCWREE
jgi:hypothetical protein